MDRALELAEHGRYSVSPNPMVGAVLVRGEEVVAEGFHRRVGGPHAEIEALAAAGERASGADLYVSLEPCSHVGRTPPCVEAILAARLRRVVIGAEDPNPRVRGRGAAALARAGIEVVRAKGAREEAARLQNEKFRAWIARGRPFVLAKWAATLDGKTASRDGRSRWITGPEARRRALLLREEYDAVLVGAGTVVADDPRLTRRLGINRSELHRRIVLDGRLRVPEDARIFAQPEGALVVTARSASHPKVKRLTRLGIAVWSVPARSSGRVSIPALLSRLGRESVTSLMVEGGAETLWSFLEARCVDRVAAFVAPRVLGGRSASGIVGGGGFPFSIALRLGPFDVERVGRDLLVTAGVESGRFRRR